MVEVLAESEAFAVVVAGIPKIVGAANAALPDLLPDAPAAFVADVFSLMAIVKTSPTIRAFTSSNRGR